MDVMSARAYNGEKPPVWRWRDIQWRKLAARQDYANFMLTGCIVIAVILVTALTNPHTVPYVLWDARISYPLDSELDTIPSWAAVVGPLGMLLLTVVVGEMLASRRQHANITDAISTAFYFFADGIQSFIMGLLLTQVFKVMVGRLRPNFLARCQPIVPEGTLFSLANITQAIQAGGQYPCADTGLEKEGRMAFPSGHTSLSFNLAVYASGYLIWVWHWRHPCPGRRRSFGEEFRSDLYNVLAKTWMLAMLCFAWGVGISRIIDYQHDVSDVVGGALLGTMIALVYLLRAIPRWKRVLESGPGADTFRLNGAATSGDVEAPLATLSPASAPAGGPSKQRVTAAASGTA